MTLGVTVGTWIVNFFAAVQGGIWERVAAYTPTAMVAEFQHGLVRLNVVLIAAALIGAGLMLAAAWMRLGISIRRRAVESGVLAVTAVLVVWACAFVRPSWDTSESRMNSFAEPAEATLRQIRLPLHMRAYLAPEDPRRVDLERQALSKLRRLMPNLQVEYMSATSIGLFEQTSDHYGEVWYELGGRKEMSRQTSAEGVLETIYTLAGVTPAGEDERHRGVQPRNGSLDRELDTGAGTLISRRGMLNVSGAAFHRGHRAQARLGGAARR